MSFVSRRCAALVVACLALSPAMGLADSWRGTAPFCAGECLPGEVQVGESDYGDGGYCITGKKVLCRNANPTCPVTSTKAECYGVVKICENGSPDQTGHWRACTTYACGACLGIGSVSSGLSTGGPTCKQGFVWREAVRDDYVCVTPQTRSNAAADNAQARHRVSPQGGPYGPATCKQGFVWRNATASDLVCVTPETRAQAQRDNAQAEQRRVVAAPNYGRDTCKQGFVWREAIANDHVCVTPGARQQARNDNAAAASRRVPNGGASGPDTCRQGFVWREAIPTDHVCVSPAVRNETARENQLARARRAGP
jgi:hypothetical protein